jgi:hypothetical protein
MRILVLGAGAIGGYFCARLLEAGKTLHSFFRLAWTCSVIVGSAVGSISEVLGKLQCAAGAAERTEELLFYFAF